MADVNPFPSAIYGSDSGKVPGKRLQGRAIWFVAMRGGEVNLANLEGNRKRLGLLSEAASRPENIRRGSVQLPMHVLHAERGVWGWV